MGFRVPQVRELDPQVPLVQQQTMINPYFSQMMQRDENSHNRQLQMMQQLGEYQARKEAAQIEGSSSWTKGLDALTKNTLPAAQSVMQMGLAKRAADDAEKTSAVQRFSSMENALNAQQNRQLNAQFAPKERQQGLDVGASGLVSAKLSQEGQALQNESSRIQLQQQQARQLFDNADAMKYGFPEARAGESVAQYSLRMEQEGKIANTQHVKAESAKMQMDMQYMPERLRLEKLQTLASIESSRASAANARENTKIARESHDLSMYQQKTAMVEKEVDEVMKGISGGIFGPLTPEGATQLIQRKISDIGQRYGVNQDNDAAISRAIGKNSSDQKAAQAAERAVAELDRSRKFKMDNDISSAKLAYAGTALLTNLQAKVERYNKGAGKFWNSEDAALAASEIQSTLDSAAIQEPRFKVYADKFREINEGIWIGGFAGIKNLFGQSVSDSVNSLINSISNTIVTEVNVNPQSDPITAQLVNQARSNLENPTSYFMQMMMQNKAKSQAPLAPVQNYSPRQILNKTSVIPQSTPIMPELDSRIGRK